MKCHFVTELRDRNLTNLFKSHKSFNILQNKICMICIDLKDFSP